MSMEKTSKKTRIALDKLADLVYNTDMLKTIRKNEMIENLKAALIIGSGIVAVIACAIGGTLILLNTL